MDNLLDYFADWVVSVTPRNYTSAPDSSGQWVQTPTDGDPVDGVLYNRSAAERYYSQTWAEDVSEVFVTNDVSNITTDSSLVYDGVVYSVDSVIDVAHQSETWLVGLKAAE